MPASCTDFVVYGQAAAHSNNRFYNPCFRYSRVIDSIA
jgi:hypothetical protein